MTTRLLVLGGSSFVGRALVADGLARGWAVTTFNRGRTGWRNPDAEHVDGDRLDPATLAPLAEQTWDVVADTWSGAPSATAAGAELLAPQAGWYAYVSSCSVYAPPPVPGADEDAPTVDATPDADEVDYAEAKRGSELAVERAFGDRASFARCGLILGPHEDVGRLPWWLGRLARGGEVLAPGPEDLPLQCVDARDLARFVLDGAVAERSGPTNVVSRRGHATMGSLLAAGLAVAGADDARPTWVDPDVITDAGVEPWTELPIWLPPTHEDAALHDIGVERAHAAGLRCRPIEETVADTWAWLTSLDGPPPGRPGRPAPGLDPDREQAVLATWHARGTAG